MMATGPLDSAFQVYYDLFSYKSGIYYHVSGQFAGGHEVRVVGWGVSGTTNYWIVANSWGIAWGESGWFRIRFGDSGIDSSMFGCTPDTSRTY
jgi:cathepsin B